MGELEQLTIHLDPHESLLIYVSQQNMPPPLSLGIAGKVLNE